MTVTDTPGRALASLRYVKYRFASFTSMPFTFSRGTVSAGSSCCIRPMALITL